jgi:hypothetical protein
VGKKGGTCDKQNANKDTERGLMCNPKQNDNVCRRKDDIKRDLKGSKRLRLLDISITLETTKSLVDTVFGSSIFIQFGIIID